MRKIWICIVAAAALLAGALPAAGQTAAPATGQATGKAAAQPPGQAPAQATDAAKPTAEPAEPPSKGREPTKRIGADRKTNLVNLNAATKAQLKALPGGSDEEAAAIIAGRPYNSKADLISKKAITQGRYYEIKSLVVAGAPAKPATAKK